MAARPTSAHILVSRSINCANSAAVLPTENIFETVVCIAGLLAAQCYMRNRMLEKVVTQVPPLLIATAWVSMAFAIIITQGKGDAFIYFQF